MYTYISGRGSHYNDVSSTQVPRKVNYSTNSVNVYGNWAFKLNLQWTLNHWLTIFWDNRYETGSCTICVSSRRGCQEYLYQMPHNDVRSKCLSECWQIGCWILAELYVAHGNLICCFCEPDYFVPGQWRRSSFRIGRLAYNVKVLYLFATFCEAVVIVLVMLCWKRKQKTPWTVHVTYWYIYIGM